MNHIASIFKDSWNELKNVRSLTGLSLLLALSVLLSFFFRLELGTALKVGVAFIATALMGALYGPVAAGLAAGVGDILKYLIKPTGPYFFGFTLTAILAGMVYGLFLYKGKTSLPRIIAAKTIINLAINGLLSTYWLTMLYGKSYRVMLWPRLVKNAGMLPIEITLLFFVLPLTMAALRRAKLLPQKA